MAYDPTYHRRERLRAMERWSHVGVLERRADLPIERAFAERIASSSSTFFKPVALRDSISVNFHRQLSYLVDAFDALPQRVDIAFDSVWKAFESASADAVTGTITDRLRLLAGSIDASVTNHLCGNFPVQSCEYLFKRLVSDPDVRVMKRMTGLNDVEIVQIVGFLKASYDDGSTVSRRKGALLLRRALRGDVLQLGGVTGFQLSELSRSRLLISLFLYTARNDRFHGESFSPFVSSAASMSTYTHPYFSFLASYYLLLCVWLRTCPVVLTCDAAGLKASLDENLNSGIELFGRHWER